MSFKNKTNKKLAILIILIFSILLIMQTNAQNTNAEREVYILNLKYSAGNITIENAYISDGYAPEEKVSEWFLSLNNENKEIYRTGFKTPLIMYEDGKIKESKLTGNVIEKITGKAIEEESSMTGNAEEIEETEFTILAPYDEKAKTLNIARIEEDKEEQLASINVENLPQFSPQKIYCFNYKIESACENYDIQVAVKDIESKTEGGYCSIVKNCRCIWNSTSAYCQSAYDVKSMISGNAIFSLENTNSKNLVLISGILIILILVVIIIIRKK